MFNARGYQRVAGRSPQRPNSAERMAVGKERTAPLTEYLEYFQNWKGCKSMKRKAGDGDRTRDVQLGNMSVVCLSKTSLFNTFIESYGI